MNMITHNAEIFDPEAVSPMRSPDDRKEELLYHFRVEYQFFAIDSSGDVVAGALPQLSWCPHNADTRVVSRND